MTDSFLADIKRLVADPAMGPILSDELHAEASRLMETLLGGDFELTATVSDQAVVERLGRYTAAALPLARGFALAGRWSGEAVRPLCVSVLERVMAGVDRSRGQAIWADLSYYPGVLLMYAAGIGALAGNRYDNLRGTFLDPRIQRHVRWASALEILNPHTIMDERQAARVAGLSGTFTAISELLAVDVRGALIDVMPDDSTFDRLFDRFEYFLGLVHLDVTRSGDAGWGPTGRFAARQFGNEIDNAIEAEIAATGDAWPPLRGGFFGGSLERLQSSLAQWRAHLEAVRREWR